MSLFADSITVKVLDESQLLYGKGNKLILKAGAATQVCSRFPNDKIHQISFKKCNQSGAYQVVCSAGRDLLVTEIFDNKFQNSFIAKISDWISSIKILEDGYVAVLTAHNVALLLELNDGKAVIKVKLRCDENSTLYCSHIHGSSWLDLTFFGGTALGELVIWSRNKAFNDPEIDNNESLIKHRQFLHNGVIFSIDYDEKYLITSSDDRSIKIFNVQQTDKTSFHLHENKQLFGHTSRVFICKIVTFNSKTVFLSAGEDSNLCVWSEAGDLLSKKNVSASGIIWNLDYDNTLEMIVTCSSTGKLNKFLLREILFEKELNVNVDSLDKEFLPAKLRYLENGTLIVLDSHMEIHAKRPTQDWIKIAQPKSCQKFVAMEVVENRLLLAGKNSITVFDYCEKLKGLKFTVDIEIVQLLPVHISLDYLRAIHALNFNEILVSDASGLCILIDIDQTKIVKLFQIPKSVEPWTTSAAKFNDFLIAGDRVGNLFLFPNDTNSSEISLPIQKLWKLHGNLGVTTIKTSSDGFIKTTGNDGTLKTLFLNRSLNSSLIEIHRCERTSVNWIEKTCNWSGKEFLLGFNDNYFVIYHRRQIIYEHGCGGRHRHWDVSLMDDEKHVHFTYIQKKQIKTVEFVLSDFSADDDIDWHTLDCNDVKIVGDTLISGGEDTMLKITSVYNNFRFHEIATIHTHISSIKAIATWRNDDDLWIFSVGGNAQIAVTRLTNQHHIKEEFNFTLASSKKSIFNPDTKFTSIFHDDQVHHLYVACSDGFVRIFRFVRDTNVCRVELLTEHFYGKCILRIYAFGKFILTMATDGFVCFWLHDEASRSLKFVNRVRHNQSGINCFDIVESDERGKFLIGTSGDDAEICVTEFVVDDDDKVKFRETVRNISTHIAQVTGFKFTSSRIFYTASIDQTICKLEIGASGLKLVDKRFTCISDVKGLSLLDDERIVVYGAGLEVLPRF